MAIGTPTVIANNTNGAAIGSGSSLATTVDAPVGSLIVFVIFANNANASITSVTLSSGDAVTQAVQPTVSPSIMNVAIFYALNTAHDLPISGTITVNTSAGFWRAACYAVSGANGGLDKTNSAVMTTASLAASLATVGLGASSEIAFAGIYVTSTITGWTEGVGFTTQVNPNVNRPGVSTDIVSVPTAITWAPSWTGLSTYSAVIATFEASGSVAMVSHKGLTLVGVG